MIDEFAEFDILGACVALLFMAIGLVIVYLGVRGVFQARAFARRAQRVPGVVTDVKTRLSGVGDTMRARTRPVLVFTTLEGREITVESREGSDHGVGAEVEVYYDPANPTAATAGMPTFAGFGQVAVGLALAVMAFGLFSFTGGPDTVRSWFGDGDGGYADECFINDRPVDCSDFGG
ncbi:hypothetical protein GCM10022221_46670 [Actinocorallia aurea]